MRVPNTQLWTVTITVAVTSAVICWFSINRAMRSEHQLSLSQQALTVATNKSNERYEIIMRQNDAVSAMKKAVDALSGQLEKQKWERRIQPR